MPWEIKQDKPLLFPKTTKAVLYDALYIEKQNLSKGVLNKLQRLSSFSNPEFFVLQNLRKSPLTHKELSHHLISMKGILSFQEGLQLRLSIFSTHIKQSFLLKINDL